MTSFKKVTRVQEQKVTGRNDSGETAVGLYTVNKCEGNVCITY